MIYLAGPYSHPDPKVMEERFERLTAYAAKLMAAGEIVYSPITHNHPIAIRHSLPRDWSYWKQFDCFFLKHAKQVRVYLLDGWTESVGVAAECELASTLGIPIFHVIPS